MNLAFAVPGIGRKDGRVLRTSRLAFNNAGVFLDAGPVTETTDEVFDRTMNVNVRGVLYGMKHEIPAILQSGGGAIVNNASALGLSVIANAAVYNASKFAVIGLTKTAAIEFSAKGVRVNAVCPAVVETDINAAMRADPRGHDSMLAMHPIGRFGKPEEIAAVVLFLCSPGAGFTWHRHAGGRRLDRTISPVRTAAILPPNAYYCTARPTLLNSSAMRGKATFIPVAASLHPDWRRGGQEGQGSVIGEDSLLERVTGAAEERHLSHQFTPRQRRALAQNHRLDGRRPCPRNLAL